MLSGSVGTSVALLSVAAAVAIATAAAVGVVVGTVAALVIVLVVALSGDAAGWDAMVVMGELAAAALDADTT